MTTNKPIRVQIKPQIVALLEPIKQNIRLWLLLSMICFFEHQGVDTICYPEFIKRTKFARKNKEKKQESADKFSNIESINKNKEKKKIDPFSSPKIKKELIPDDLQRHADLIIEWWPIRHKKKATCSEKVAQRIFKTLRSFTLEDQIKSLEMAIIGGYKDVYKPNLQKIYKKEEPVVNHPASRVFTAERGFE